MKSFEQSVLIWNGVALLGIALVATLTNGALLVTLYRDPLRCFRNAGSAFIAAVAVTDFMTGAISAFNVGISSILNSQGIASIKIKGILQEKLVSQFTVRSGILVVTAFSFDRLAAVVFPYFYRRYTSYKNVKFCAIICCIVGFAASALEIVIDKTVFDTISYYGFFISPLVLITISYLAIYTALKKRLRLLMKTKIMPTITPEERRKEQAQWQREKKLVLMAFYIVLGFVISYSPWFTIVAITTYCKTCTKSSWYFSLYRSSIPFLYVNSALNPLLYAWRIPKFRKSAKIALSRTSRRAKVQAIPIQLKLGGHGGDRQS